MNSPFLLRVLLTVNAALIVLLIFGMNISRQRTTSPSVPFAAPSDPVRLSSNDNALRSDSGKLSSPFAQMYASDPKTFAANLRAMGCPEETVKDIILSDISRQFQNREANLRPKPADHVPITWAPNPPERKLFQRRQEAALIAREKAVAMRNALGYDVPITKPIYSLTTEEQEFENSLTSLPPQHRHAAANAHEQYLAGVQMLCDRTQGFWLAEDLAELDQLKAERRNQLDKLTATP